MPNGHQKNKCLRQYCLELILFKWKKKSIFLDFIQAATQTGIQAVFWAAIQASIQAVMKVLIRKSLDDDDKRGKMRAKTAKHELKRQNAS